MSKKIIKAICPGCNKEVEDGRKCRFCGATRTINQVSGNEIWMRNGRVVQAFKDSKTAYIEMAKRNGIEENRWPKEFRVW